jgi:endonuclease-3/nuclear cap-binding protein subunit 2
MEHDKQIRTDWDASFVEGRQYGKDKTDGHVRDEFRTYFDEGRPRRDESYPRLS